VCAKKLSIKSSVGYESTALYFINLFDVCVNTIGKILKKIALSMRRKNIAK